MCHVHGCLVLPVCAMTHSLGADDVTGSLPAGPAMGSAQRLAKLDTPQGICEGNQNTLETRYNTVIVL